jgi:hypothetical protein
MQRAACGKASCADRRATMPVIPSCVKCRVCRLCMHVRRSHVHAVRRCAPHHVAQNMRPESCVQCAAAGSCALSLCRLALCACAYAPSPARPAGGGAGAPAGERGHRRAAPPPPAAVSPAAHTAQVQCSVLSSPRMEHPHPDIPRCPHMQRRHRQLTQRRCLLSHTTRTCATCNLRRRSHSRARKCPRSARAAAARGTRRGVYNINCVYAYVHINIMCII